MRSGIRRNRRGRWCEKGVKDVDEIPDKEMCHSQGYSTASGPFVLDHRMPLDAARSPVRSLKPICSCHVHSRLTIYCTG